MRALPSIAGLATVFAVLYAGAEAGAQPAQGDPGAGEALAQRVCDACHTVSAHQELAPLVAGAAPSFFDIAKRPGTNRQSLRAFLAHAHPFGQMPYPHLTAAEIADLSAYIISLRRHH